MTAGQVVRALRWYLREVTGEAAYDRYVAHARRCHPEGSVLLRREFERRRMDRREIRGTSRCC